VSLESEQLVARYGVPDFAGAVVASSDELVARLVECAIGERQDMGSKDLEQEKITCFIAAELFYQFYKKNSNALEARNNDDGFPRFAI